MFCISLTWFQPNLGYSNISLISVIHILYFLVWIKLIAFVVKSWSWVFVITWWELFLGFVRFAWTLIFYVWWFLFFGAFLISLAGLLLLLTGVIFYFIDPLLKVEAIARITVVIVRYVIIVINFIVITLLVLFILTDLVNYCTRLLAINDRIFRYYVWLLSLVVSSKFKIFFDGFSDGAGFMRKIRNFIFNNVSLLTVVSNLTNLILDTICLLTFVTILVFKSFWHLSRISFHLRRHGSGLFLRFSFIRVKLICIWSTLFILQRFLGDLWLRILFRSFLRLFRSMRDRASNEIISLSQASHRLFLKLLSIWVP